MTNQRLTRALQVIADMERADSLVLAELDAVRRDLADTREERNRFEDERDEARKDSARLDWLGMGDNIALLAVYGGSKPTIREDIDAAMAQDGAA